MKKSAFTLAEVLITLGVIGVVAVLSLPVVTHNSKNQEFKTGIKKAVSALDSAVALNIAEEHESPFQNKDLFNYLQRHMKLANKNFMYENGNHSFFTKDGMRIAVPNDRYKPRLYSGVEAGGKNGRCGSYGMEQNVSGAKAAPCVVVVDVNGNRKPRANYPEYQPYPSPYGEEFTDFVTILITEEGAVPYGVLAQKAAYDMKN